ncbi:MAG: hypothetical protein IKK37_02705 [Clostridia bacterium]|nr:hypothetical protein [Clostridia bacterium]
MAFGTIRLRPVKQPVQTAFVPPVVTPPPVEPKPNNEYAPQKETVFEYNQVRGIDNLRIAVVAENETVAKDYVCSLYSDLLELACGTMLSVYISKHETSMMIDETKRNIEDIISTPKNTKTRCPEGIFTNGIYEIVVGEAANQHVSVNVYFNCLSYGSISAAANADAVFVILNKSNLGTTAQAVESMRAALPSKAVSWIVTGFEREHIFYSSDLDYPPSSQYIKKVSDLYGVPSNGDTLCLAQQYGGLVVEEAENGLPVYMTISSCREYTPVACSLPLLFSITDLQKTYQNEGTAFSVISRYIQGIINQNNNAAEKWCKRTATEDAK